MFRCTRDELLDRIDADEYSLWVEYYKRRPWGCEPADIRAAIISTAVNRSMGGRAQFEDFLPGWQRDDAPKVILLSFGDGLAAMKKIYGGAK